MGLGEVVHFHMFVENLEETERFFIDKLGFKLVRRGHAGRSVDLAAVEGGPTFEFFQIDDDYKNATPETHPNMAHMAATRRPYLDHICFEVDDVEEKVKELKAKGVKFLAGPVLNKQNGRLLADFYDPDGHAWIQLQGKGTGEAPGE